MVGRIVIDDVHPSTPNGYPAKAVIGESVLVSADIFKDGHDVLAARVRWRPAGTKKWAAAPMREILNDRWEAVIEPQSIGEHKLVVEAWTDRYETWRHASTTKLGAGQDIELELAEGAALLEEIGDAEAAAEIVDTTRSAHERIAVALHPSVAERWRDAGRAGDLTSSPVTALWVDRERALYGSWYELFPRSEGGFKGTLKRLPAVAEMGFDIVYFPPIHPIGRSFRKGPNNTLDAGPDDVGSPWAIGSDEGGHTAIHSGLGTLADFTAVVGRAAELGMEIALDYALQCSPDHPWVTQHPEWFHHRPDGSIAYAENPPKKYQDIYPINFWPADETDRAALWQACKEIFDYWIDKGIRIFRVDNPHTKPVAFWEWCLAAVRREHPDVLFLAEAFTRPKVMARLAEVGFTQSYTYFTWRNEAWELREYLEEIAHGPTADYMRPSFWPNTPDILSGALRDGPPAAFRQRAVLAATMAASFGIYSGYELIENRPMAETNEEYLRSEKYELKKRDWSAADSIAPFIASLNRVRRAHPALQRLRNIHFHSSANEKVLVYSKHTDDRSDVVLVAVNLDPLNTQESTLGLDLATLGLPWDQPFEAFDELSGQAFRWTGAEQYVRLDPFQAAHILHLRAR